MELSQLPLALLLISSIHSGQTDERPKPRVTINPDHHVFRGETVTLRCDIDAEAITSWKYYWYKGISSSVFSEQQEHIFWSVSESDAGKYSCYGLDGSRWSQGSDAVTLTVSGLMMALTVNAVMSCGVGEIRKKGKCEDEDECVSESNICEDHATCSNTAGSYYCRCNRGFGPTDNFTQADGIKCQDINECADGSVDCGSNAECMNTEGGYSCTCNTGYISSDGSEIFSAWKGVQCIDRDECADPSLCGKNATCINTPGDFYCTCAPGFRLKSGETNFTDPDLSCMSVCETDKSICGEGGDCQNGKYGHECVCRSGFTNFGHKQEKCTGVKLNVFCHVPSGGKMASHPPLILGFMQIIAFCRVFG